MGGQFMQTPTSSRLKMSDNADQLALAFNSFFALLVKSLCKLAEVTTKADHFSSIIAGLSQLSDAIETSQQADPVVVDDYNELLSFLMTHYPEGATELAQASSMPSFEKPAV